MAKKAIRVKTGVKVVRKSNAARKPVKPTFNDGSAPGFLTTKIAVTVKKNRK